MVPRAFNVASDWLRLHRPNTGTMKIAGAFAGGIACTGIAIATWNMPERAPHASAAPQVAQAEVTPPPRAAAAAKSAPSQAATPPQRSCDSQTWPYINQNCQQHGGQTAKSDAAPATSRRIRVVSTDGSAPDTITTGPAAPQPVAVEKPQPIAAAEQAVASPPPTVVASTPSTAAPVAPAAPAKQTTPDWIATASAAIAPAAKAQEPKADESAEQESATQQAKSQEAKSQETKPQQEPKIREAKIAPDESPAAKPATRKRADVGIGRRGHKSRARIAEPQAPQQAQAGGHNLVVTQTYQLSDGRHLTVTKTYLPGTAANIEPGRTEGRRTAALREPEPGYDRDPVLRYQPRTREVLYQD